MEEGNRAVVMICLAGGFASLAASFLLQQGALSLISAALFFLSLFIWKYGYWAIPFFTRAVRIVETRGSYEIPPSQDMVIKKSRGGCMASVFLGISLNEGASGKTEAQKGLMMELFERALSSLRCVTKISMMVSNLDLNDYVDQLKARRSLAETRLAQAAQSPKKGADAARLEREISHYTKQIEKLGGGEKPMQVVAYAMTTADGLTREEAVSRARAQSQQVAAVLANSLGASVWVLSGEHMRRCFEWEYAIPSSQQSLSDQLF